MTEKRFMIIGENYTNIDIPVFIICKEDDCCFEVYESKEDAQRVCDKLNNLINENEQLKQRNDRQAKQLDRLYCLIEEKDWRALTDIIDDFKKSDEQLQREWGAYGDVE